jgi:SulP family sulfate permease
VLARLVPALVWGRAYSRVQLSSDLTAAVIVTLMMIPQSLAYAMLAGLPPYIGLYASILPLVAYALFGSSQTLAVGPVAIHSLLTATAVGKVAAAGTPEYLAAAIALALLSGALLIAMGIARLGFLANLLSHPVISGFVSASAVLIALSQLKHILGVPAHGETVSEMAGALFSHYQEFNLPTLVIGALSIVFLSFARRRLKALFGRFGIVERVADLVIKAAPILAIAVSTGAVAVLGLTGEGVKVVGEIPRGMPPIGVPAFNASLWLSLLPAATLLSVIGFVESMSVAQTLAAKRRQRLDPDQELIGLGAANIAASLSGGYPVTGGFARSVVNFDAGAQTPMAGVFTAAGIAATLLFLTPLIHDLPLAVLAATIIVAVLSLVDLGAIRRTWLYSKSDFAAMALTIALVLGVGVVSGLVAGVLLSLLLFLWRTSRPHMAIVGQVPGTEHFRNIDRHKVVVSDRVLSVRVDESLYFANARFLEDRIYALVADRPTLEHVVLVCPAVNFIDASALESLEMIAHRLRAMGVTFHLSEVKGPVTDRLARSDFFAHLTGRVFLSQHEAMAALDPETTRRADRPAPERAPVPAG